MKETPKTEHKMHFNSKTSHFVVVIVIDVGCLCTQSQSQWAEVGILIVNTQIQHSTDGGLYIDIPLNFQLFQLEKIGHRFWFQTQSTK